MTKPAAAAFVQITIRVSPEVAQELRALCAETGKSANVVVSDALVKLLASESKKKARTA